jgi:hypothetical protein
LYNRQQYSIERREHKEVPNTNETQPNINKGKRMGLVAEQNPQNQRARPLVNAKGFTKIVRRRS